MHVFVNAAMSADGKISSRERSQIDISGPEDFDRVDRLRAESDAVMVGVGTVLADDPSLTLDSQDRKDERRKRGEPPNPARVIVDSRVRTPPDATVLDEKGETYLLVSEAASTSYIAQMEEEGATVITAGDDRVDLATALEELESRGIDQLMVEGGGEIIYSMFAEELVDELSVFVGPLIVGGRHAPTLADGDGFIYEFPELELGSVDRLDDGVVLEYDIE